MQRCAGLTLTALGAVAALAHAAPPAPRLEQVELRCEAVYLPARSTWVRSVQLTHDDRRIRSVRIDGQAVYAFDVRGTTLLTGLDNERIQIDMAQQTWHSDFRGQATGEGRCERVPQGADRSPG